MQTLSPDAFQHAKRYLFTHGRPLEQMLFEWHFEYGTTYDVLKALKRFQNKNGGFGHALEPDLHTPVSSVLATITALKIMCSVEAHPNESVVEGAIGYLLNAYNEQKDLWEIIPPEANDAPRAFWWDYDSIHENFRGCQINPRADVLGYLHHFSSLVNPAFLAQVTRAFLTILDAIPAPLDMHEMTCLAHFAETENIPNNIRDTLHAKLAESAPDVILIDPAKWHEYGLTPGAAAPTPHSALVPHIPAQAMQAYLDYEIKTQQEDGSWPVTWSWEVLDPDAWAEAKKAWQSVITLEKLLLLNHWGRIAER